MSLCHNLELTAERASVEGLPRYHSFGGLPVFIANWNKKTQPIVCGIISPELYETRES